MDDVVEEILARLDPEDVLRCKSLCKSWYNLISTTFFVKAHLKRSFNNNREHGYFRIYLRPKSNYINGELRYDRMVGSCNGLVCISSFKNELLVTNPCTRELRKLPILPYKERKVCCWGFGYDSSTDDYKVVVGFNESEHHMRVHVLSLKSNQWKLIIDVDNLTYTNIFLRRSCVLYNGELYWFMYDTKMKKKKRVILSFDLSLEKFKEIPQPDDHSYSGNNRTSLGIFEECLCIFNNNLHQIWVMKDYDCWQLVPHDYEGKKYGAATTAYILYRFPGNTWHFCDDEDRGNLDMSLQHWSAIGLPIFVKSLVSPSLSTENKRKRRITRPYRHYYEL